MNISEICNILKTELYDNGYEYGFYLNGRKYRPDISSGFDAEYDKQAKTIYRVQQPAVTMREKIGTCIDAVLVMRHLLSNHSISSKIWLLYNKDKNKPHTILTFSAEEKIVYLELTPQSAKPWYGKEIVYSCEEDMLSEYRSNNYDVDDVTDSIIPDAQPSFLLSKIR